MRGPMRITDPGHTPVRGDLADIRLAGQYFVPHYAVPLIRQVVPGGAALLATSRIDADVTQMLSGGARFAVLDVAGELAWGQAEGDAGPVGYIALAQLEAKPEQMP